MSRRQRRPSSRWSRQSVATTLHPRAGHACSCEPTAGPCAQAADKSAGRSPATAGHALAIWAVGSNLTAAAEPVTW